MFDAGPRYRQGLRAERAEWSDESGGLRVEGRGSRVEWRSVFRLTLPFAAFAPFCCHCGRWQTFRAFGEKSRPISRIPAPPPHHSGTARLAARPPHDCAHVPIKLASMRRAENGPNARTRRGMVESARARPPHPTSPPARGRGDECRASRAVRRQNPTRTDGFGKPFYGRLWFGPGHGVPGLHYARAPVLPRPHSLSTLDPQPSTLYQGMIRAPCDTRNLGALVVLPTRWPAHAGCRQAGA